MKSEINRRRTRLLIGLAIGVSVSVMAVSSAGAEPVYGAGSSEATPASDAFAAAHLALISGVFLWFAVFAWVLYRRAKAPNKEREFIEDLHEDQQRRESDSKRLGAGADAEDSREPWEKSGDWWKKD